MTTECFSYADFCITTGYHPKGLIQYNVLATYIATW